MMTHWNVIPIGIDTLFEKGAKGARPLRHFRTVLKQWFHSSILGEI